MATMAAPNVMIHCSRAVKVLVSMATSSSLRSVGIRMIDVPLHLQYMFSGAQESGFFIRFHLGCEDFLHNS